VNGVPFLTTISRVIRFGSATEMSGTTMDNVVNALKVINTKYRSRGFKIIAAAADNGFSALENNTEFLELNITLNLTAEDEHEPYIERFNRTIKEKCRMGIAGVPFTKLPKRMIVELVYTMIFWYNFTIPEDYVSNTLGAGAIVLGLTYNYNALCGEGSKYGEYV